MDTKSEYNKEFFVKELVSLFTDSNIAKSAAGGIFTFKYGHYIVDKYTPTELMEAAHNADSRVKARYAAELNAAFLIFRHFENPMPTNSYFATETRFASISRDKYFGFTH